MRTLAVVVFLAGCGTGLSSREEASPLRSPRLPPSARTASARASSSVHWRQTLDEARADAADSGKSVFVFLTTSWCGPCKRMEEATFHDPTVTRAMNARLVPVRLDAERGEGKTLCEQNHINSYPTMMYLQPSGPEIDRAFGYHDSARMIQVIGDMLADRNTVGDLRRRVASAPGAFALRQTLALRLALRGDSAEALQHLDQVLAADPNDSLGLASQALFTKGRYVHFLKTRNTDEALAALGQLLERFPKSGPAREGALDLARLRIMRGQRDLAVAALTTMVQALPADPQRGLDAAMLARQQGLDPLAGSAWAEQAGANRGDAFPLALAAELAELGKDLPRALRLLKLARERAPNDRVLEAGIRRLEAQLRAGGTI